jgi:hypothetical protein
MAGLKDGAIMVLPQMEYDKKDDEISRLLSGKSIKVFA